MFSKKFDPVFPPAKEKIVYIEETTSTNEVLKNAFLNEQAEPVFILKADKQTRGKGRRGRKWWSPPAGALMFSMLLPKAVLSPLLPIYCGIATALAIEKTCNFTPSLKWPNDIMVKGRKCGGILCEKVSSGPDRKKTAVIAGIGLNTHVDPASFPPLLAKETTSLHLHSSRNFSADELFNNFLLFLKPFYDSLMAGEMSIPGHWVTLYNNFADFEVSTKNLKPGYKAVGISKEGCLMVENQAGDLITLTSPPE